MSGQKSITVDSAEYARLRAQSARLRQLRTDLPEVIAAARAGAAQDAARQLEPIARRQDELHRTINGMAKQVRDVSASFSRCLEDQQRETTRVIAGLSKSLSLRAETRALIEEQNRKLEGAIADERKARQRALAEVNTRLDGIAASERGKHDAAQAWVQAAGKMRDFVDTNYRHGFFAPGQLAALEKHLQLAGQNLSRGLAEAAVTQAQAAYGGLDDLRMELERQEQEWQLWKAAALASTAEVLAVARAHRTCQAVGLNGEDMGTQIEVDWWTEGKLAAIENEIGETGTALRADSLPAAELRHLAEVEIPGLRGQVEEAVEEARSCVVASQLRINIADLIVQSLEAKGYRLEDGTYAGEDMRGGYAAKVSRVDGTEVVVTVDPVEGCSGRNDVRIHSFDEASGTQHERTGRAREIGTGLRSQGIQASDPAEAGHKADPAIREIEAVRRRKRAPVALPAKAI